MKKSLLNVVNGLSIALLSTACQAQEPNMETQHASHIEMNAAQGQDEALAEFLQSAAPLVAETEPGTELWFALRGANGELTIFDIFANQSAMDAHFGGDVAGALNANAGKLVAGGWNDGVLASVETSQVLSATPITDVSTATTASYIKIKAAPGQAEALTDLLRAAGPIVAETEPLTLYWVALQIDEETFAIFDIFAAEEGRAAHFAGQVAGLLQERSPDLVEGGWEGGVVANVRNYDILASK